MPPGQRHPRGRGACRRGLRRGARLPHGRRHDLERAGDGAVGGGARGRDHPAPQRAPQCHQRARAHRRGPGLRQPADERSAGHLARHVGRGRQGRHRKAPLSQSDSGQQPHLLRHLLGSQGDRPAGPCRGHEGAGGRGARHAFLLRREHAGLRDGRGRRPRLGLHAQIRRFAHPVQLPAVRPGRQRRICAPDHQPDPDDLGLLPAHGQPGYFAQKPRAARQAHLPQGHRADRVRPRGDQPDRRLLRLRQRADQRRHGL